MSQPTIRQKLFGRLTESHAQIHAFFENLDQEDWDTIVLSDSGWTVTDELRHLISTEQAFLHSIKQIVADESVEFARVDLDAWNIEKVAAMQSLMPNELLASYNQLQGEIITLLDEMNEDDWGKSSAYPVKEIGELRVSGWFKLTAIHRQMHLKDLLEATNE